MFTVKIVCPMTGCTNGTVVEFVPETPSTPAMWNIVDYNEHASEIMEDPALYIELVRAANEAAWETLTGDELVSWGLTYGRTDFVFPAA